MTTDEARRHAYDVIRRHGSNPISFQLLETRFRYWFNDDRSAMIAYYVVGSTWVAAGDPVCAEQSRSAAVEGFLQASRRARKRVCFFGISEQLIGVLSHHAEVAKIGEQPWWDPSRWDGRTANRRTVRSQVRRAQRRDVSIRRVEAAAMADPNSPSRQAALAVLRSWLSSRRMANMGFIVGLEPFSYPHERFYLLAERVRPLEGGAATAVGFLAAVPVHARNGWLIEDLLRSTSAPNGTTELLIDGCMRALGRRGATYATLGLVPLRRIDDGEHAPRGWLSRTLGLARRFLQPLYSFTGQEAFKVKFRPDGWESVYLAAVPRIDPLSVLAILRAFTDNRPVRFGVITLSRLLRSSLQGISGRRWQLLAHLFALTLIVWIVVLGVSPDIHWFGQAWLRIAWIVFDLLMVGVFLLLARGARRRSWYVADVAAMALGAAATDLVLTAVHATAYYLSSSRGVIESLVASVAVSGPMLASLFFFCLYLAAGRWRTEAEARGEV